MTVFPQTKGWTRGNHTGIGNGGLCGGCLSLWLSFVTVERIEGSFIMSVKKKNSWVRITATQNCLPDESPTGRTKGLRAEILSLLCKCIWSPAIPPALTVSVDSLIEGIPSLCTDNPHSQLSDCVCFGPIGWVYRWCQGWQYSLIDAKISLLFESTGLNGECSSLL